MWLGYVRCEPGAFRLSRVKDCEDLEFSGVLATQAKPQMSGPLQPNPQGLVGCAPAHLHLKDCISC